ncbi:hypothetical protein ABR737_28610 [Streptomyces sp. Edi2]|uniref:hypothetical protein n=1 Tax=Streptomyces sp. Edi2 TaxID=3162528 RepID=UPI0033061084
MISQSGLRMSRTPQALPANKDPRDVAASGGVAINPWEVDDMAKTIARIFESLLRLLLPARGRHRSFGCLPTVRCEDAPTLVLARVPGGREGLSSPDGKPCFLVGDGTSYVSRLADNVEAEQLDSAADLMDEARRVFAARTWTPGELHLLAVELASSLANVHRVAKSRGARLPVPDDEGPNADGDGPDADEAPSDHDINGEDAGPRLPAESFG